MAGRPLEAMALIGLGYRSISMAPVSIGPVKSMVMSLDVSLLQPWLFRASRGGEGNLRGQLKRFAEEQRCGNLGPCTCRNLLLFDK